MYQVQVSVVNGDILVSQDEGGGHVDIVSIHPDQAELVCKWIMDAAMSIQEEI